MPSQEAYYEGKLAYELGEPASCPIRPCDELRVRIYRRSWYDGYYDAMLRERYRWWDWHRVPRISKELEHLKDGRHHKGH